jgi:hypothetical protein
MFAIVSHPPCLIFAGKARSLPLEWSPVRSSALALKYKARVEVIDSDMNTLAYH